jgi:hypothetical protein
MAATGHRRWKSETREPAKGARCVATTAPGKKIEIGRVISCGVDTVRRNLPAFAGLALLCGGISAALSEYALPRLVAETRLADSYTAYIVPAFIVDFVVGNFLTAILVRSSILHLNDGRSDVGGSALVALRMLGPLLLLSLLATLMLAAGLMLLIVPGIIVYLALIVAVPVLIVERRGIVGALRRSVELTRGSKGQILLIVLIELAVIVVLAVAAIPFVNLDAEWYDPFTTAEAIVNALTVSASTLVSSVLIASLYLELRTVKEGATLERLAAVFE